jgi:hypothetical protein
MQDESTIPDSFSSLSTLFSFIEQECLTPKPRLGLLSVILGELEEKDGQFPLSNFLPTYNKYLEFLEVEMKPCLSENKATTVG